MCFWFHDERWMAPGGSTGADLFCAPLKIGARQADETGMNTIALTLLAQESPSPIGILFNMYLKTLGWALVGSVSMGLGLVIALTLFTVMTRKVDEWQLIKENNMSMAVIMAAVVLGTSIVVAVVASPG